MPSAWADDPSCRTAYEEAADQYWPIVADIMQFKALFDDYDRLCRLHFPEEIAALQPAADLLRTQTGRELATTEKAVQAIFNDVLPHSVPPACKGDDAARNAVRKKFIAGMTQKSKTLELRMKKSARTLHSPKESLTLCQKLPELKPKIERILGPELENPLLEMGVLNRAFTKKPPYPKKTLKTYRQVLKKLAASEAD